MFYAESQGPWNGSCSLKVLEPGGFMGHPVSFNWYELAPELGDAPVKPNTPSRMETERQRVKELVPYAVVFPYKRMGRSISGFMVDRTGGKFGPFENQIFIGDFSLGVVMRVTTEKVNGVWQGACYPFREGFDTGLLAVQFTPQGQLIAGGTNRGWPVRGPKAYAVQRLDWTGLVPFEIKQIVARPTGFEIEFTKPVDVEIASQPENYQLKTFTHIYRQGYGSPEVDQTIPTATRAVVSDDGLKVSIDVDGLVQGHVHDFYLPDMKSAEGENLLHANAYYTLNEIPLSASDQQQPQSELEAAQSTKNVIDFQRPANAVQLVGDESVLVPESAAKCNWVFDNGILTASPTWDSVVTPRAYQDFRLHVEFNINDASGEPRQRNGNSGIYIQQRYELQILNSHGIKLEDYKLDDCSCIYGFKKPDQLVNKPAGEWQTFDIAFKAARFDKNQKTRNARITVYQNGVLIHDDVELKNKTGAGKQEDCSLRPIKFQGHRNEVQYRNVWIERLSHDHDVPEITASQKKLPGQGEVFKLNGNECFVILPRKRNSQVPQEWVWYAPTLSGLPADSEKWMFEKFLDSGVAVAGIDVGESYGSPAGRSKYDEFHAYLTEVKNFSARPALLARSRGGLMLYSWAAENPELVSGIAGIYPVCNIASYPGIEKASGAFGMSAQQLKSRLTEFNPIDRLEGLARAKVPIFHIHGDVDTVVPLELNSALVAKRYRQLGGDMKLEVVEGQGHNMWEGWFQSKPLVKFLLNSVGKKLRTNPVPENDLWLTYDGAEDKSKGKHVVLIAAEQEYRSEQSMPMLAKILSQHHGFDCTVLFCVNDQGLVDPTLPAPFKDKSKRHRIPGLKHLANADCLIWSSRFMQLSDDQMKHFHDYFDSGKPLIALRTANHGFSGGKSYQVGDRNVDLRELLGGVFMGHHGGWKRESTRGIVVEENKDHPILRGVDDVWGPSDVYRCHTDKHPFPEDCSPLLLGQPLVDLNKDSEPNSKKEPLPVAWVKTWQGNTGKETRIFHFTMGSAKDFENAGVRRATVNAVYWGSGLESEITEELMVDIVGDYQPLKSGFNYKKLGVEPRPVSFYK